MANMTEIKMWTNMSEMKTRQPPKFLFPVFEYEESTVNITSGEPSDTDIAEYSITESTETRVYIVCFIGVIMTFTILGNLLNITVMLRTKSLRKPTGNFVVSLATADFIVGILVTFSFVSSIQDKWAFSDSVCKAVGYVFFYATSLSMMNLLVLTFDRWICVTRPMKYHTLLTNRTSYKVIAFIWVGVLLIDIPMLIPGVGDVYYIEGAFLCSPNWRVNLTYTFVLAGVYLLPCFILVFVLNMRLYFISRRHIREMELVQKQTQSSIKPPSLKPKIVILTIVIAFEVSWFPFFIVEIIRLFYPETIGVCLSFVVSWVAVSNSFMNAIIYTCLNRKFRDGVKAIFRHRKSITTDYIANQESYL